MIFGVSEDGSPISIDLSIANRHGIIAGATGTGKTVSLQVLAEIFSSQGVPVFITDVKGDLSGFLKPGDQSAIDSRLKSLNLPTTASTNFTCDFWKFGQGNGIPIRTTPSELGAALLSRLLDLNETQESLLQSTFKIADENKFLLLDSADVKALLNWILENQKDLKEEFGSFSSQSVSTIVRKLVSFESTFPYNFLAEPACAVTDLLKVNNNKGVINVAQSTLALENPSAYSALVLWIISELYEDLPEQGDKAKPKIVLFIDEAHLVFRDCNRNLLNKLSSVVRLIRSRGVGIFFVTQNPADIPDEILGQLGNRVHHAMRIFTPKDEEGVKSALKYLPISKGINANEEITKLEKGQALVSFLDSSGAPLPLQKTKIRLPLSQLGLCSSEEIANAMSSSELQSKYSQEVNSESAAEVLAKRKNLDQEKVVKDTEPNTSNKKNSKSFLEGFITSISKTVVREVSYKIGREIARGVLGTIKRR
jgi:uncharacterized protein